MMQFQDRQMSSKMHQNYFTANESGGGIRNE